MTHHSDLGRARRVDKESPEARMNRSHSGEGFSGRKDSCSGSFRKGNLGEEDGCRSFEIELELVRASVEE